MGVISNSPRSASTRSTGNSAVLRIEADTFMDLLNEKPQHVFACNARAHRQTQQVSPTSY